MLPLSATLDGDGDFVPASRHPIYIKTLLKTAKILEFKYMFTTFSRLSWG